MNGLGEMELRILSELEEANQEDVVTLINTVTSRRGTDVEFNEFLLGLQKLVNLGHVVAARGRGSDRRLIRLAPNESLDELDKLASLLRYDNRKSCWTDGKIVSPPFDEQFPYILNTRTGKEEGFKALDARGYQWWKANT